MEEQIGVRCGQQFRTYPQVFAGALRATRGLHELGVGAGDRVALLLRNSLEFLEASIATVPLGASGVPINWHWRGEEIAHVLTDSGAKVLVAHGDLFDGIAASVPAGVVVVLVDFGDESDDSRGGAGVRGETEARAGAGGGWTSGGDAAAPGGAGTLAWADWIAALEPWGEEPERAPMSIIYTSGTTGKPKGVVRTPSSDEERETMRATLAEIFQLGEGERTVIPAPMYHSAPNVYALACALQGMDMTIMERFDAEEFLRIVQERRVTVVQMVPTMFSRLLALPESVRESYDVSSLRGVVHAAAPCPEAVKRGMIEWLGPIVAEYYGSTETGPVVYCTSEQWLAHPGTVGRPIADARVKIFDEQGRELPPGESGEVYAWLDLFPDFTYANDEEKRRAVERDGLITCGDIGYLDEDGFLYLNDRRSDMVITGGVNVYPAEIEACLLGMEGVRDVAVFGIPDEEFGEALAAHVEPEAGAELSVEQIRDHVKARLAAYKTPRLVEFSDALPREDSGKIFKRRLREPYWAGRERSI